MATFTSKATGNWDAEGATTWNEAGHPVAGDTVTIQNGHTVTLDSAAACTTLTIDAGGVLTDATNNVGLTVSESTVVYGTLTCGTADMSFGSGYTGADAIYFRSGCTFTGGSGNHTMGSVKIAGNVTLTSGKTTVNATNNPTYSTTFGFYDSCTFSHGNGTIEFTRTTTQAMYSQNGTARSFYNLIANGGVNGYLCFYNEMGFELTIENDLTITTGTFANIESTSGDPCNLIITGNLSNSGTFTRGEGSTVTLNGTSQSIDGDWSFWHFTKSVDAADTLTFEHGKTYTFGGNVTLEGADSQLLSLVSDSAGSAFNFNMSSGAVKTSLDYLSVKDSNAVGSHSSQKPISPTHSVDVSGNSGWFRSEQNNNAMAQKYYY